MTVKRNTALLGLLSLFVLTTPCAQAQSTGDIAAAYVLYTQNIDTGDTVSLARIVIDGVDQPCPSVPTVATMRTRTNPDPAHFPITVCEGIYSATTATAIPGSTLTLPALKSAPEKIVVVGDTGYKSSQISDGEGGWVFPELAAQAAKEAPDLVLHMGDYNYSGTPGTIQVNGQTVQVYDAGDNTTQGMCRIPGGYYGMNTPGSNFSDSWSAWKSNLFDAAQSLMSAAPFVFARGNHELCSRAGNGWFYLLDANSPLLGKYAAQLSCPSADNPTPTLSAQPFLVHFDPLNLLVVDAANACDSGLLNADDYVNQFALTKQLQSNAPKAKQTWLVIHRPVWGIVKRDDVGACGANPTDKYCHITRTLLAADHATGLSEGLDLVLSGHMHRFQAVGFKSKSHAQQLILGNGGVKLASLHPKSTKELAIDGHKATVQGLKEFGYMTIELDKSNWQGVLMGDREKALMKCKSGSYPLCAE
ncbi:metallophosphoesterase [Endothiovibrio diazotrophicus]